MKNTWSIVNIGFVALGFWGGYRCVAPKALLHANPDPIMCGILLVIVPAFALGTVYYSKYRWSQENKMLPLRLFKLLRPSWDRSSFNWWDDPLQSLFISTCYMASMAFGAAVRRPEIGSIGFWMLGSFFSIAAGLVAGQLLIYRLYHRYIAKA
jgi:hypothetical protein